jgi:MFS family permease
MEHFLNANRFAHLGRLSRSVRRRSGVRRARWTVRTHSQRRLPTLYNRVYHLSLAQSLRAGTPTNVAQVVILLGCAFVIDRIGRRRWTIACLGAGVLLLATLGLFAAHSVTAVIVFVTLSYGLVGSINAVLYLYSWWLQPLA